MDVSYVNPRTGSRWSIDRPLWRAPDDGGTVDLTPGAGLAPADVETGEASLWRYARAIRLPESGRVSLGEGFTPMVRTVWSGRRLAFKCDHVMPTGSFKDRGTAVMMSYLRQVGVPALLEDSSGNAGASVAAYAAAAGIGARILVPAGAPEAKRIQIAAAGPELVPVAGTRDDVAQAAMAEAETRFYASHNRQPFFLEGMKTLAFELWEQSGFRAPSAVVAPCGNGANILGLHIGFGELLAAGAVDAMPRLYAVQAANISPVLAAVHGTGFRAGPTVADGIAVAEPVRLRDILGAVRSSGGRVVAVGEADILASLRELARAGWFVEPTSATAVAALPLIAEADPVVVLTGTGLKASSLHATLV